MSDPQTTPKPKLYRPVDVSPEFAGLPIADWIDGWQRLPGWDRAAAERAADKMIAGGALVEVPSDG